MSNLRCKDCKSTDVTEYTPGIFGDSRHRCNSCGKISVTSDFVEPTVFDRITASPEVLAPYCISTKPAINCDTIYYHSTVTGGIYLTESQAVAATVEKFKEVFNG